MRVIGFSFKKINIERKNELKNDLEIKSGLNIDDITKEGIHFSEKPSLKFDFTYSVDYEPNMAKIEIKGSLVVLDENDEGKNILKEWKKKKFDHPSKIGLFNFIMNKCNIKAIVLEDEIGLPIHLPFPRLAAGDPNKQNKQNNANYAG